MSFLNTMQLNPLFWAYFGMPYYSTIDPAEEKVRFLYGHRREELCTEPDLIEMVNLRIQSLFDRIHDHWMRHVVIESLYSPKGAGINPVLYTYVFEVLVGIYTMLYSE